MQVIIDRFENKFAVIELENKVMVNMPKCLLPSDSLEGDVISIKIDREETNKRYNNIKILEKSLWED